MDNNNDNNKHEIIQIDNVNLDDFNVLNDDDTDDLGEYEYENNNNNKSPNVKDIEENDINFEPEINNNYKEEISKEELKNKNNIIDLINQIYDNFNNCGKRLSNEELDNMTIIQLEEHKNRLTKRIINKGMTKNLDTLYNLSNNIYEIGLKQIDDKNFEGVSSILNNDTITKDCFKLMILEKMNLQFQSPTTRYLYGITMGITTAYTLNKSGLDIHKLYNKININNDIKDKINKLK